MTSRSSRIAKTLLTQLVTEVTNKVLPLIVLHLVVQRLGTEGFGLAKFGFGLVDMMVPFVIFGYLNLASVDIGKAKDDGERGQIIWEVIWLKLLHSVVMSAVLIGMVTLIPGYAEYRSVVFALAFLVVTTALDMNFVHVGTTRLWSLNVAVTLIKLISFVAVITLVQDTSDVVLFAVIHFGSNGAISLFSFFLNFRKFGYVKPSLERMRRRFSRSLPYVFIVILGYAQIRFDLFVVEAWFDAEGAGLYGGVQQIVFAIINAVAAINLVFFSEAIATRTKADLTRIVDLGAFGVFAVILPIVVGTWFVDDLLVGWILNAEFIPQASTFSILILGLFGHGLLLVFGSKVLMFKQEARKLNIVMALAFCSGLGLSLLLVDKYAYQGVAFGVTLGRWVAGLTALFFASTHLDHLPWKDWMRLIVAAAVMAVSLALSPWSGLFETLGVGIVSYGASLLVLNKSRVASLTTRLRS